jgi:glutamate dehydrogenase (NADP+)
MLKTRGDSYDGKVCLVSGAGNVAQYTTEKIIELGGKVVTLSDSGGYIYDEDGLGTEKLAFVMDLKNNRRGRISEYADKYRSAQYFAIDPELDYNPLWNHKADCAFPSATQNESNAKDAQNLINNGVFLVSEGANMPTVPDGVNIFIQHKILYGPGKAANAGGVSTSGLEMAQNATFSSWSRKEVDTKLHNIMISIHAQARAAAEMYGEPDNYVLGANAAGFSKVADAMIAQGVV